MVQPKGDKANFIQWWDEDPGWRRCVGFITVPNICDKIYNGTAAIPPTLKVGSF